MPKVNIRINDQEYLVDDSKTILEVAEQNDINIPRLCYFKGLHEEGNCRLCSVEVSNLSGLKAACKTKVFDNMNIYTNTKKVVDSVKINLELLSANHKFECWSCSRENNCEFLDLLRKYEMKSTFLESDGFSKKEYYYNDTSLAMTLDSSKCVLCERCVSACEKLSGLGILNLNERGSKTYVGPALFHNLEDSGCIYCGKCIQACPTGAISEHSNISDFENALRDKTKTIIVQVAPSVRIAVGEEFGYPIGTNVEGQMYASLKKLGIKEVMDTNFAADLTIMEEANEFIERFTKNKTLPMFTSCSPGWINYLELYSPELIPNLSSCKSPQQMAGAIIKTYYAEKLNLTAKDIISVSLMPCVAKKTEAARKEMGRDGYKDVDIVLTTKEFAKIIKNHDIDFRNIKPIKPFGKLAEYTGAGAIFGATGGVMEAALRTVKNILDGNDSNNEVIEFKEIRGIKDIKEATYNISGHEVNVAVVHGGVAIKEFLKLLKTTDKKYHFVEVMGCTGGCVNGGGQPVIPAKIQEKIDVRKERGKTLYKIDSKKIHRRSDENEGVKILYKEFLEKPNSNKSHKLLHTTYQKRNSYTK